VIHKHLGGRPPAVDLAAEQDLARVLVASAKEGLLEAAHDLSDGGLAIALAEAVMRHGVGAKVDVADVGDGLDAFTALFSESAGRALVAVSVEHAGRFGQLLGNVPCVHLGTTGGRDLVVEDQFTVSIAELKAAHEATLPAVFGE
jgi:phosphoribosylformylglycinamidine synthase